MLVSDQPGEGALLPRGRVIDKPPRQHRTFCMTILGAILAGGASRRFGSDKAVALLNGRPLLDHVRERLAGQCDAVIVVGRAWPGLTAVADRPAHGLGPLGALAGALHHAAAHGHGAVLTSGCDLPDLPTDLCHRLGTPPAVIAGQPLLGLWPVGLLPRLDAYLADTTDRSMRGWIGAIGARQVTLDRTIANVNRIEDLAALVATGPAVTR